MSSWLVCLGFAARLQSAPAADVAPAAAQAIARAVSELGFVLQKPAIRQRFDTRQRLLQREGDPEVRRQLLVQLLETPQAIEKFIAGTALESLIGLVGADQDAAWRQVTLAQVLFSAMLHHEVASLSARCHRRLEEAFSHAQRAVELEPNNTAYQDTLAETQDQLPHR